MYSHLNRSLCEFFYDDMYELLKINQLIKDKHKGNFVFSEDETELSIHKKALIEQKMLAMELLIKFFHSPKCLKEYPMNDIMSPSSYKELSNSENSCFQKKLNICLKEFKS